MAGSIAPEDLRTAYAKDPIGIDERTPTFRWLVRTDRRGAKQRAFRVRVASGSDCLAAGEADVWDTGRRRSDRPAVRYDGPDLEAGTEYHWTVRIWDERGKASEWSDPATFETGPLDGKEWVADWIRRPEAEFTEGQFTYVRRDLALDGEVERARAYVSACHQYALSINGAVVDRGQSFSYPDFQYYKTVDVTADLRAGTNAVGALYTWNGAGQGRPAGEPGFLLQLEVAFADGSRRVVTTDGDWRWHEAEWLDAELRNGEIREPVEVVDGRDAPAGWDEPGFDDAAWEPVEVVGEHPVGPWERLIAQDRGLARTEIDPESIAEIEDGTYVVDFGRVYAGVPVVDFEDGRAGHRVEMLAGYRLDENGRVDDAEGSQWTDMRYAYVQPEGESRFRPFNYLGLRYLQIDDPGEDLDADGVGLVARYNDVPDTHAATFACADDTVEAVFELARHSAQYGSQEQFVDTPTREKGQFVMDAFNVSEATTRAFGERRLSRQALREFLRSHYRYWAPEGRVNAVYPNGDGRRDIPDFTISYPEWLARYYRETDDRRTLERAYPLVRAIADYVIEHVEEETGLVTHLAGGEGGPYHEGIVDWPPEMRYGYDRDWPARTTVNVLAANALDRAAEFATELGQPAAERAYYETHRDEIEAAINDHLREGDHYVDGGDGTEASDHASQHANALPLATGIAPEGVIEDLADRIVADGMRMGPMTVRWVLDALEAADRPDAFVALLTDREGDGWANILATGGTFTWESWHCRTLDPAEARHNRSESHAMGATVLTAIQRTLLGVHLNAPGGADLAVEPPASGLDRASGRVPTERGPLDVSWERDAGGFSLAVTVPWNASATVVLPVANPTLPTESGKEVVPGAPAEELPPGIQHVEATDDGIAIRIGAGDYRFVA